MITVVLRGVYAATEIAHTWWARARALHLLDPDVVFVGPSAAVLLGWRQPDDTEPVVASSSRIQGSRPGFRLSRRRVPHAQRAQRRVGTDLWWHTEPAATSLDLAREHGPQHLDDALRRRVPLAHLWRTFDRQRHRRGNRQLRQHLHESRDQPWSPAERAAHQALRAHGVTGWHANHPVLRPGGRLAHPDIALPHLRLAFEIDGYAYHQSREAFRGDRLRDLDLRHLGWEVVRLPAAWVLDHPDVFARTVTTLAAQRDLMLRGLPGVSRHPTQSSHPSGRTRT